MHALQKNSGVVYWRKGGVSVEVIVGIVLVALILLLAGVDLWYLLLGGIALVALAAAFTAVFFLVCVGMLLRSQRRMGEFTGFSEGGRFDCAEYTIGAEAHRNVFPAEFILRDRLYRPGKPVRLFLTRSGRVFDRNAYITTLLGTPLSIAAAAAFTRGFLLLAGIA